MLAPGQDHDLTCAEPLLENADPDALIGDKAFDADALLNALEQRDIAPVIPPKANRKEPRDCDYAPTVSATLSSDFSTKLSTFVRSQRATTNSPEISWPQFSWFRLSFCLTEHRP